MTPFTLHVMFKESTSDRHIDIPVKSVEHGIEVVGVIGLSLMEDAHITYYHSDIKDSNPYEEVASMLQIAAGMLL